MSISQLSLCSNYWVADWFSECLVGVGITNNSFKAE